MKFLTYFLSLLLHGDLISTFAVFLKQLREENLVSQSHRFAPGTAQNMISGVRTWFFFCVFYQLQHCPATPCDLVLFLELMAITVTYNHLKHLLSSIKFYHRAQNLQFPEFDFNIVNTLQGIKRRQSHTPHQALPLTPDIMRAMYYHLDMSKQKDRALWCSYHLLLPVQEEQFCSQVNVTSGSAPQTTAEAHQGHPRHCVCPLYILKNNPVWTKGLSDTNSRQFRPSNGPSASS